MTGGGAPVYGKARSLNYGLTRYQCLRSESGGSYDTRLRKQTRGWKTFSICSARTGDRHTRIGPDESGRDALHTADAEQRPQVGPLHGFQAAVSDLFYCLLTGFGLSFIEGFLERNQDIIQLIGSAVPHRVRPLHFPAEPVAQAEESPRRGHKPQDRLHKRFSLHVFNPLILFLIVGLFARFNFLMPGNQVLPLHNRIHLHTWRSRTVVVPRNAFR